MRSLRNRVPISRIRRGFSLVEVVLAVFIVAAVMVPLLVLISTGMGLVGEAGEISTEGRIAQGIIGELRLAEWDSLPGYNDPSERYRYYDHEGQEIEGTGDEVPLHTALIRIEGAGLKLPGTASVNPNLRMARIFVSSRAGSGGREEVDLKADDYESGREVSLHSKVLVRMDKALTP